MADSGERYDGGVAPVSTSGAKEVVRVTRRGDSLAVLRRKRSFDKWKNGSSRGCIADTYIRLHGSSQSWDPIKENEDA
jgi:hypothetical protein